MVLVQLVVLGVLNFLRQKMYDKLHDAVIHLHDIARTIELEIGSGKLSSDLRDCADRLAMLIKVEIEETKWKLLFTEPFLVLL